jgi:hypothetical protein
MIKFYKGYKYQLAEDHISFVGIYPEEETRTQFLWLRTNGWLTIFKGYAWDGPSGPAVDTANFMRASLVHDALYQLMRMEIIDGKTCRKQADIVMREITKETGMWWLRRKWCFWAVRKAAESAADPKNVRQVLTAP